MKIMNDDVIRYDGDRLTINECKHCGLWFISGEWLNYHIVWMHKGDGY